MVLAGLTLLWYGDSPRDAIAADLRAAPRMAPFLGEHPLFPCPDLTRFDRALFRPQRPDARDHHALGDYAASVCLKYRSWLGAKSQQPSEQVPVPCQRE
jgi:hypothetical protein